MRQQVQTQQIAGFAGGESTRKDAIGELEAIIAEWLPPTVRVSTLARSYPDVLSMIVAMRHSPERLCERIEDMLFQRAGKRPFSFEALTELSSIRQYARTQISGFRSSVWDDLVGADL